MQLPTGATVAVADGERLLLFRNTGHDNQMKLTVFTGDVVDGNHPGADAGHHSSAANPDQSQVDEDGFAVGVANLLNRRVLAGDIDRLVIIAPPRTLGELRKHYHPKLSEALISEIGKELTGHSVHDIEKAISAS
jgi:protein required for attachment to host cells